MRVMAKICSHKPNVSGLPKALARQSIKKVKCNHSRDIIRQISRRFSCSEKHPTRSQATRKWGHKFRRCEKKCPTSVFLKIGTTKCFQVVGLASEARCRHRWTSKSSCLSCWSPLTTYNAPTSELVNNPDVVRFPLPTPTIIEPVVRTNTSLP